MRKTLLASVLLLALCGSALAGDINSPPLITSPPQNTIQSTGTQTSEVPVETETQDTTPDGTTPGDDALTLTEVALRMFDGVLALF